MAANLVPIYEKLVSNSGIKLYLHVVETIFIVNGRIVGWFYSDKDGIVVKAGLHEITSHSVMQKLCNQQVHDPFLNAYSYVAVALYENGAARLLKRPELQEIINFLAGSFEPVEDAPFELPYCLQLYVPPAKDLRYISSFTGNDHTEITTFARRYSTRYTAAFDEPNVMPDVAQSRSSATKIRETTTPEVDGPVEAERLMTTEELLAESQLVAAGLLDARPPSAQRLSSTPNSGAGVASLSAVPLRMRKEISRLVASIVSFVERSHGSRLTGVVAEFISNQEGGLMLTMLHAAEWDGKGSRGRMGTFTERWSDYVQGLGPPPAPQPPSRKSQGPGIFSGGYPDVIDEYEPRTHPASPMYSTTPQPKGKSRPGSAPIQSEASWAGGRVPNGMGVPNSHYSLRNVMSATRKGGGGNPTASPPVGGSHRLWSSVPSPNTRPESSAGILALELEIARERLQRQMDSTARCEAALASLASSTTSAATALKARCETLEREVEEARKSRAEAEAEAERLRSNRTSMRNTISSLEEEVLSLKSALAADRETLAVSLKQAQRKDAALEQECNSLRDENEELQRTVAALSRRLEEESEVLEASRCQLLEYKQLVLQLQAQIKRSKGKGGANSAAVAALGGTMNMSVNAQLTAPTLANQLGIATSRAGTAAYPLPEMSTNS